MEKENTLILFEGKAIRKIWHNDQWYFSVVDIIEILTDSVKPKTYWAMMKKRELQPFTNCEPLKLMASDGRYRLTDCANTEGVLRIIMSVPSPKAEPLKQWMAQVSKERIEETENPELSYERMTEIYKAKGFNENQEAAVKGGKYAGNARIRLEKQIKKPVLSPDNFLNLEGSEKKELKKDKK